MPKEYSWFPQVASNIVRQGQHIRQAAINAGVRVDPDKLQDIYLSPEFQQVLWQTRFDYYNEVASNPARGKAAMLGLMTIAIQNLAAEGEWKEVLEGVLKLGKVEGWVGDGNTNVFANLTAKDIDAARKQIEEQAAKRKVETILQDGPVN